MTQVDDTRKTSRVRFGVGTSTDERATVAGTEAATTAVIGLAGERADLVLCYASVRYDLPALLAAVNDVAGGAPVVGATSCGQLCGGSLLAPGAGLSVLALSGGGYRYGVGRTTGLQTDSFAAGQRLAREARSSLGDAPGDHQALIVLADAVAGEQQLLRGLHRVAGFPVPVIGGCAGDDRRFREVSVFFGDEVLSDAAVAVWVSSDRPLTVVSAHGWRPTGLPMMVTSVDGQVIREIGGRPARSVFAEQFPSIYPDDPEARFGWQSVHAFGLVQPNGSVLLRSAYVDPGGELRTLSPLPQFAAVQVVSCDGDDLVRAGHDLVSAAARDDASVMLIFDCIVRLDIIGDQEASLLQAAAGRLATFGLYTYAEFARTHSLAGYHNATIAAMAL